MFTVLSSGGRAMCVMNRRMTWGHRGCGVLATHVPDPTRRGSRFSSRGDALRNVALTPASYGPAVSVTDLGVFAQGRRWGTLTADGRRMHPARLALTATATARTRSGTEPVGGNTARLIGEHLWDKRTSTVITFT